MSNIYLENIIDWAVKGAKLRSKEAIDVQDFKFALGKNFMSFFNF
jgi:hypothetical protein